MLGDLIGEDLGQVTGRRVLPSEGGAPVVETSFEAHGQLLGVGVNNMGTYHASPRADGTLYGEGQGVIMTADGDTLTWKGQGVGRFGEGGSISFRGAIYVDTAAPRFTRLNSVACLFEYDVDESGKTSSRTWEWK